MDNRMKIENGYEREEYVQDRRWFLGHVLQKISSDISYRDRVFLTFSIYISFAVIGGTKGQIGPALLDLMAICHIDLETGALIVPLLYIGYTIGAMLNGCLYHRFQRSSLFAACSFGMGIFTVLIPWCYQLPMMLGTHAMLGLFQGIIDAGGNAEIIQLWKRDSRTMVVGLHLIFNVGGVLSPLIIAPFLKNEEVIKENSTEYHMETFTPVYYMSNNTSLPNVTSNITLYSYPIFSSRIHFAYIISAVACLGVSFLFCSYRLSSKWGCLKRRHIHEPVSGNPVHVEKTATNLQKRTLSRSFVVMALIVMTTISSLSKAIDHAFAAYLSTFSVDALHWSVQQGSFLTSIYFVSVVIGGLCGTVMSKMISIIVYEGIQIVIMLISFVCLAVSVTLGSTAGIWVSASLFGFSKSVIFPLTLAWTNDSFVRISGKISSIFFTASMAGSVTNPLLLGFIMTEYPAMWFCYFFLFEVCLLLVFFITAVLMTKQSKKCNVANLSEKVDTEVN